MRKPLKNVIQKPENLQELEDQLVQNGSYNSLDILLILTLPPLKRQDSRFITTCLQLQD